VFGAIVDRQYRTGNEAPVLPLHARTVYNIYLCLLCRFREAAAEGCPRIHPPSSPTTTSSRRSWESKWSSPEDAILKRSLTTRAHLGAGIHAVPKAMHDFIVDNEM
jgi:hypothetical protein